MTSRPASQTKTRTALQNPLQMLLPDPFPDITDQPSAGPVIALRGQTLGDQTIDTSLGQALMAAFLRTLAGNPAPPTALLLYGSAVLLAGSQSPVLDLLAALQKHGCEILCCQISCAALLEGGKPAVGQLADWIDLTDRMQKARQVLWP
ncbi:MAG: hypothetical protein GX112_14155 [Clostridiaceae bacterium]|nr:hypothetical protein [Clostridiaceae bacterium]